MGKRYTRAQFEQDLKARQEREAREAQERQERVEKQSARRIWVRDGGSEGDFEREWPKLRDEARRKRVADADSRARARQRATGVSRI